MIINQIFDIEFKITLIDMEAQSNFLNSTDILRKPPYSQVRTVAPIPESTHATHVSCKEATSCQTICHPNTKAAT